MKLLFALAAVWLTLVSSQELRPSGPAPDDSHVEKMLTISYLTGSQKQVFRAQSQDAAWVRVEFEAMKLAHGAKIIVRSLQDGYEQFLNAESLVQWQYKSAFFNGAAVEVEVQAAEAAYEPLVGVVGLIVGGNPRRDAIESRTPCHPYEDRVRNTERKKDARFQGSGYCSAWLIADEFGCFLTAGHCGSSLTVMAFNVPDSTTVGQVQHPAPEFQFTVDPSSIQGVNGGAGNDWKYVGVFPNSNTGLTPRETQGVRGYVLHTDPSFIPDANVTWRHFGHGSASGFLNLVTKGTDGPFSAVVGSRATYRISTTGGDSGSAFSYPGFGNTDDPDGAAMVIHTHGGCATNGSGENLGTYIATNDDVKLALANPRGICASGYKK